MIERFFAEGDVNFSPLRKQWAEEHLSVTTRAVLERDADVFIHQALSTPCLNVLKSCNSTTITDIEDREYLDFHGNNAHQAGFSNPDVIAAIKEQLDELPFCTRRYTNERSIELAEKLVEMTDRKLTRVLFSTGGTSAVGMALKLARVATGRHKVFSSWESFHGASLDAISVGGESIFRAGIGPLLPGCEHFMAYNSYRCPFGECHSCGLKCLKYLDYAMENEGDVGAVIIETIRNTDVQIPPAEYYQTLRSICDKHGALLIFDETAISMGRTGKWFAWQHFGVTPDILISGKSLGGGIMPLAAIIAKEELNVAAKMSIGHYTHEKNPVSAAAALAAIGYIEKNDLLNKTVEKGEYLKALLFSELGDFSELGHIRAIGLMQAVELVTNKGTKEPHYQLADRVMYECLKNGLSLKVGKGNVIDLFPALTVTETELYRAVDILKTSIHRCLKSI